MAKLLMKIKCFKKNICQLYVKMHSYEARVVSLLPRVHEKTVPSCAIHHNCVEDLNAFLKLKISLSSFCITRNSFGVPMVGAMWPHMLDI